MCTEGYHFTVAIKYSTHKIKLLIHKCKRTKVYSYHGFRKLHSQEPGSKAKIAWWKSLIKEGSQNIGGYALNDQPPVNESCGLTSHILMNPWTSMVSLWYNYGPKAPPIYTWEFLGDISESRNCICCKLSILRVLIDVGGWCDKTCLPCMVLCFCPQSNQ